MQDYRKQLQEEELLKNAEKKRSVTGLGGGDDNPRNSKESDMVHSQKMNNALKILERMVNQNAEDEIF